jgi:hypothetical protein
MKSEAFPADVSLDADHLAFLRSILDEWCAGNGSTVTSQAAEDAAASLVNWFQHGIRSKLDLQNMLSALH